MFHQSKALQRSQMDECKSEYSKQCETTAKGLPQPGRWWPSGQFIEAVNADPAGGGNFSLTRHLDTVHSIATLILEKSRTFNMRLYTLMPTTSVVLNGG